MNIEIKEDDFPVYQQLLKNGEPGIERAIADFNAACSGGDEEKYNFALGIQTIAANVPVGEIPEITEEMNKKTLHSCLSIFKAAAAGTSTVADAARIMVAEYDQRGLGL